MRDFSLVNRLRTGRVDADYRDGSNQSRAWSKRGGKSSVPRPTIRKTTATVWRCAVALLTMTLTAPWSSPGHAAEPNLTGQSGLVHMPDATLEADGTFRIGVGYTRPYQPFWFSFSLLPRLEFSGQYTKIRGLEAFGGDRGFGDYKDKSFDIKLQLFKEKGLFPDLAVGLLDFTGTRLFEAKYAVLTKRAGPFELTLGYGEDRIDGPFGGIRFRPSWSNRLSLMVEYDANDYQNDFRASLSGAERRKGEWTWGLSYRGRWYGGQLALQDGDLSALGYIAIPLMDSEFVPKISEPPPYTEETPQVGITQWLADTRHAARIGRALSRDGYKNVELRFDGHTLNATLANTRITGTGRAVGRAIRILQKLAPRETEEIHLTYTVDDLPLVTYRFRDRHKLDRYFEGLLSKQQLASSIEISPAEPRLAGANEDDTIDLTPMLGRDDPGLATEYGKDGHTVSLSWEGGNANRLEILPFNFSGYFNDPSGAYKYDLFATASYRQRLRRGLFLEVGAKLSLLENVSDVSQTSNSLLPHVRSDIAEYRKHRGLKLERMLINRLWSPKKRTYMRLSAGIYEEMYAGVGGQILFLPKKGNWAVDLSIDWLKQRDFSGGFGFQDYSTLTALGGLHYRIPRHGLTLTLRGGRFLAGDDGVRFEVKRRFRSGVEFGGWYTITNGDDITSPGSPDDPYHDKGIFISIPLNSLLTRDTQATASFQLSPWTRDVGQMVASPLDLYRAVERPLNFGTDEKDLMSEFGQ